MSLCLLCSFCLFVLSLSISLHPHHWEGERRKHVLQELEHLQWKACCIVHSYPCCRFGLAPPRHSSCPATLHFTAVHNSHLTAKHSNGRDGRPCNSIGQVGGYKERRRVTSRLFSQQTKEASPQASSSSPPASAEKQEEKKSEKSPPASDQQEEKKPEDSPQPHEEEVTLKVGSGAASEDPSPPESKKPEDSKDPSPPESKPQDSVEDDLLEFTSATEGEGEASSSAWELVPERKIARKKGVKSDSEIDSLVKKVIKKPSSQRRHKSPPRKSPPQQVHLPPQPKMLWPPFQRIQQQRQPRKRGPKQKRSQLRSRAGRQTSVSRMRPHRPLKMCSPLGCAVRT